MILDWVLNNLKNWWKKKLNVLRNSESNKFKCCKNQRNKVNEKKEMMKGFIFQLITKDFGIQQPTKDFGQMNIDIFVNL